MAASQPAPDWLRLQRKIFSRWCNLKVSKRGIVVKDVVTELGDGLLLVALLEVLSEKECTLKLNKDPKMRPQKLDNVANSLKFLQTCGVEMKLKPSAEDLVDGNEKAVLGLIWAIMLKFIKIGDEDEGETLNAKDSLLLWIQNKLTDYNIKIEKFGKEFHDGMALCALIHKHRPKLIPWESLKPENKRENLQVAIDAAEKYFGLEKYLTPDDIPKLDENSMVIYLSEYYYGIAEQRKLDLAARRIGKVVKLTEENDALKAEFNTTGERFKAHLKSVEKILEDRSIDNTMAGAKKRIEEYYGYKTKDKNLIIADQLNLEALYNTLSMRLSHNKRPEYVPPQGLSLKDIEAAMAHLEACEQERSVALHAELNRQIRLAQLDDQHKSRYGKLKAWINEKEAYLKKKESINSVSGAQLHLRLLDAADKEMSAVHSGSVHQLKTLGEELVHEKYERSDEVKARESEVEANFVTLGELSKAKRPVLEDDLAREEFKEKVRLLNKQHIDKHKNLVNWITEKESYLNTKESISSVSEARTQLSLLETYENDKVTQTETNVAQLKKLGAEILASKYETKYSSWVFETPEEIKTREAGVDEKWKLLADLSAEKKRVLDDDLAREEFKAKVRLQNANHIAKDTVLQAWIADKEAYLNTREKINSISEAQTHLSLLDSFEKEKVTVSETDVHELKTLGAEILAAKYSTKYSSWVFETPDEVRSREANVDSKWELLSELSAEKKRVLDDHLAREEFKERVRVMNRNHIDKHEKLQAWISEKEAYLNFREEINSVSEAQKQLSLLETFEKDKVSKSETNVAQLKKLGAEILAQKYETKYSSWVFETPEEIKTREASIDEKWKLLADLSAEKKRVLDDHLAREEFKEKVRLMNTNHVAKHDALQAWVAEKEAYLNTKEHSNSISEAQTQLSLLEVYEKEKVTLAETSVTQLKRLGADILAQKYQTKYSSYVFENPSEIKTRESAVDGKWETLSTLSAAKKKVLESDLAREIEKERLRLEFAHLAGEFDRWVKDNLEAAEVTHFGFTLAEVEKFEAVLSKSDSDIAHEGEAKKAEYDAVWKKLGDLQVTENIYTSATPDSLAKARANLQAGLDARKKKYDAELARQRANDALCKEFANVADPFSKWISETKETITKSKDVLDSQLQFVNTRISSVASDGAKLADIKALSSKIEAAGITNNRHTTLTLKDVEVQWEQYQAFLSKKKKMLEEEIEHAKMRGLTSEQFKEIQDNFNQFDSDKSGTIDKKELKACLYSLGEDKNNSEVTAILQQFGKNNAMPYEGFKEFMIGLLGDSDTKEEIINGFALINRGADIATVAHMELVMKEHDLEYIVKTAPKSGAGYDYKKWTEDVFAR